MTTLAALKVILQSEVPAVNSVPTSDQYDQAIKDAVADFSRRCGKVKNSTLPVVSGTATYTLPSDFLQMIELESPFDPEHNVMITSSGIVPFNSITGFEEEVTIQGLSLTIYPTPEYTVSRFYEYKAGWVLSGGDFVNLGDAETSIVMIKAKQLAKDKIKNSLASSGSMKYSFGAVSVDKGAALDQLDKDMFKLHGDYVEACKDYNGAVGGAF